MTEDEMVGWHHRLDGLEFEQSLKVKEESEKVGLKLNIQKIFRG